MHVPNHCYLKYSCPGEEGFSTEANSDIYFAPGYDFFEDTRVWGFVVDQIKNLGIDLPRVPFAWLVLPLVNQRTGGTCKTCTTNKCNAENCEEQKRCLLEQYRNYPQGEYGWTHHNSNTYAGTVARACCDKINVPGGVSQAWGWNDEPYPEVPHIPIPITRIPGYLSGLCR